MCTTTRSSNAVAFAALFITLAAATAIAASPFDIEFPIPELGNCADKNECKAYCNKPENLDACEVFAAKHGLGDAKRGEGKKNVDEFIAAVEADGGPDGVCGTAANPIKACEAACGKQINMKPCIEYAIKHKLLESRELDEAKKVLGALERGVKLPEGCKDEESCRETCEDPATIEAAESCFAFAAEAGLLPPEVNPDQARKAFETIKSGKGGFKSFKELRQCEKLNDENVEVDETLFEKCLAFGVEQGLVSKEERQMIEKTGGKGPGNCRGRRACEEFCSSPENQEACFRFAEEHDLLRPEDRERIQEGASQFKEVLGNAPPGVKDCLEQAVPGIAAKIDSGAVKPFEMGKVGPVLQSCFAESFGGGGFGPPGEFPGKGKFPGGPGSFPEPGQFPGAPGGFPEGPNGSPSPSGGPSFPPAVQECLSAAGVGPFKGPPSPEVQATIQTCFKQSFGNPQGGGSQGKDFPSEFPAKPEQGFPSGEFPVSDEHESKVPSGPSPDAFQKQFDQQFQQQFQKQSEQQIQEQIKSQFPAGVPTQGVPEGSGFPGFGPGFPEGQFPGQLPPSGNSFPQFSPDGNFGPSNTGGGSFGPGGDVNFGGSSNGGGGFGPGPSGFSGGGSPDSSGSGPGPGSGGPSGGGGSSPGGGGGPQSSLFNPPSLLGFFAEILGIK